MDAPLSNLPEAQVPPGDVGLHPGDGKLRKDRILGCGLVVVGLFVLVFLLLPVPGSAPGGRRTWCKNNLRRIGLALHNYHDKYGSFPPAFLADSEGRPMHSWRVLILPFLDQTPLYNQYRFDEPWNGPHNSQLHDQLAGVVFHCPSEESDPDHQRQTSYVAVVGPETAWPAPDAAGRSDMTNRPGPTIQVIEVANSGIHWMEPRDLTYAEARQGINSKPPAGLAPGSRHQGGIHALFEDGSVRFLSDELSLKELRTLLTRNVVNPRKPL